MLACPSVNRLVRVQQPHAVWQCTVMYSPVHERLAQTRVACFGCASHAAEPLVRSRPVCVDDADSVSSRHIALAITADSRFGSDTAAAAAAALDAPC